MKKNEMREAFRQMLERRKELMVQAVKRGSQPSALMLYGEICGVAAAMCKLELIDREQLRYIKDEAWAMCQGKEPEYEAC